MDRTSTGGDPLPEELQAKEELKARQEADGKPAIEIEMDAATDKEFGKAFGAEMDRVRKEWSKGRPHWYLVSPLFDLSAGIGVLMERSDAFDLLSFLFPVRSPIRRNSSSSTPT